MRQSALTGLGEQRPGSASSHIGYGGSRKLNQRFEYSADSQAGFVELSPEHRWKSSLFLHAARPYCEFYVQEGFKAADEGEAEFFQSLQCARGRRLAVPLGAFALDSLRLASRHRVQGPCVWTTDC